MDAWLAACEGSGIAVFVQRNGKDTIHEMQPNPGPADKPVMLRTGDKAPMGIVDGRMRPRNVEALSAVDIDTLLGEPMSYLLDGQGAAFIELPASEGTYQRLLLRRMDATPDTGFAEGDSGGYVFRGTSTQGEANEVTCTQAENSLVDAVASAFGTFPPGSQSLGGAPIQICDLDEGGVLLESGFDFLYQQQYLGLPVFDSSLYAIVNHDGTMRHIRFKGYSLEPTGEPKTIQSSTGAAELAAQALIRDHPDIPCRLTSMLLFYGWLEEQADGSVMVRPLWGVEFDEGKAVYTIGAEDGAILSVELLSDRGP